MPIYGETALIRAGKVIDDRRTKPREDAAPAHAAHIKPLSRGEREAIADSLARDARKAREHAQIDARNAARTTFKHVEPKSIHSPAGHCMIQRVAPAYKEKRERDGHWAPYRTKPWNSPSIERPSNRGLLHR